MAGQDDFVKKAQEIMAESSPGLASNLASQSVFTPASQFVAACEGHLNAAVWERFSTTFLRYTGQEASPSSNGGPDVFDDVRTECRTLLEGRPALQAQWDGIYGPRVKWQMVYDAVQQSKRGKEAKVCG